MADEIKNQNENDLCELNKERLQQDITEKRNDFSDTKAYSTSELKNIIKKENKEEPKNLNKQQKKEEIKAEKERLKNKSKQNRFLFRTVWIVMVVLLSIMASRYILLGVNDMLGLSREERTVSIEIPKDSGLNDVTRILTQEHVIDNAGFFKLYSVVTNSYKTFTHGSFDIKTNMDYENVITYLQSNSNRTDIINATFTEGMSVIECASLLEEKGICSYNDFLNICKSNNFDGKYDFIGDITNSNNRYYKLEGYLFPDTYQFYKDENPDDTVDRFLSNYKNKINTKEKAEGYDKKVSINQKAQDKDINMDKALIIASIIQAEAANTDDMYKVSSVIYNRLGALSTSGINSNDEYGLNFLCMDSTVYYPYRSKSVIPSGEGNSFKSTYDTYSIEGLPPGPICNPGIDAINAAINPESTEYYYFCHSKDGTAYYAKTKSGHEENLKKAGLK